MNSKKLIQFDWAIKTLLRHKANFPILEGFLSELLHTDVKIESLLESESNKKHSKDKFNRLDVLAKLGNGERVIIEVQCERQLDFDSLAPARLAPLGLPKGSLSRSFPAADILSRMLYGVSKVVVEHLKEGDFYGMIPRVISVNIVYFDLGHGEDYIYHGTTQFKGIHKKDILQLGESEKKHYPPHIDHVAHVFPEYYVLKVSGFDLKIKDTLDEWIYALKESEVKPEFKAKGIREAAQILTLLNLSDEERFAYERHIGDTRISGSTLATSFSQGVTQGKKEIVLNMHQLNLPIAEIAKLANLSKEEVEKILLEASK